MKTKLDMRALAIAGAEAKLDEYLARVDELTAFLEQEAARQSRSKPKRIAKAAKSSRRRMTAAERHEVSVRMRRFWRKRRAELRQTQQNAA